MQVNVEYETEETDGWGWHQVVIKTYSAELINVVRVDGHWKAIIMADEEISVINAEELKEWRG
jgi:hypothetical protein